jgi:diaminopimelate decarboxylase
MNIEGAGLSSAFSLAQDGSLVFDGIRCDELAKANGTPLYVYSAKQIRANYERLSEALQNHLAARWRIFYAYKGNPSPAVCRVLHNDGAGAEVVSEGELTQALGYLPGSEIIFNNVVKTERELELAVKNDVHLIIVDSQTEFEVLNKIAGRAHKTVNVGFRVRPGITAGFHKHVQTANSETKFGLSPETLLGLIPRIKDAKALRFRAVHVHLGSQISDLDKYEQAAEFAFGMTQQLRAAHGLAIDIVDLGGGMGIQDPSGRPLLFDFVGLAARLQRTLEKIFGSLSGDWPALYFEPNRSLVGNAGILLGSVVSLKRDVERLFVGTDTGYSAFVRPMLYGATHEIRNARDPFPNTSERYDIVGPLCESGDVLGRDVKLATPRIGDVLVVFDAGAYGFAQASQYNSLPRPAEVLIDGGTPYVIRRREKLSDLNRLTQVPPHLESGEHAERRRRADASAASRSSAPSYAHSMH